jgi:Domain of unknown function (DUF4124)
MKKLLVIALAVAFSSLVSAQAYKWIDKNGHVQYGDTPPGDAQKVTRLKPPPPGMASTPAPDAAAKKEGAGKDKDKALTPEQAFQKRQQERADADQKAAKERAEADTRRTNCEQAQANLRQLQSGARVASVNAAGERVFVDDDQRAREIERAQKAVADWCK